MMVLLKSSVTDGNHMQGSERSEVTIVEYGDYQCSYCGEAYPTVKEIKRYFAESRFSTWLARIVFNTSLINLRRLLARPQMPLEVHAEGKRKLISTQAVDAGPNPEEAFHQIENKHAVQQATSHAKSVGSRKKIQFP